MEPLVLPWSTCIQDDNTKFPEAPDRYFSNEA